MINCELTPAEQKTVNGCGSSYWLASIFRIPSWASKKLTKCCDRHDIRYQHHENKQDADWELYNCMYYSAYHSPPWQKWIKIKLADLTFRCLNTELSQTCYREAKSDFF